MCVDMCSLAVSPFTPKGVEGHWPVSDTFAQTVARKPTGLVASRWKQIQTRTCRCVLVPRSFQWSAAAQANPSGPGAFLVRHSHKFRDAKGK